MHPKVKYDVIHAKKAVIVHCPSELHEPAIQEYFLNVLEDSRIDPGSTEYVDLTHVKNFGSSYDTFWTSKSLYARIAREGTYVKTVFVVRSPVQNGMASTYAVLLEDTNNEFEITRDMRVLKALKSQ